MRILSYNIQATVASNSYLSYVSRLHRQILPVPAKKQVLANIARYISEFDIVCLQEVDLGGLRNGFNNHAQQLTAITPFSHCLWQINRVIGNLSRHGNLILSKTPLTELVNCRLPSFIKGRGILAAQINTATGQLVIANVHLSLGKTDQYRQIDFIVKMLQIYPRVCLMGDFNCLPNAPQLHILAEHGYRRISDGLHTFPSWRPTKTFDHIFIKGNINGTGKTESFTASDHLPVIFEWQ